MSLPRNLTNGTLGMWTLPFRSLARISTTFLALNRFPSSQRPCLSSDGMSTEWVFSPLRRRPLPPRDGRGLLLVAAHVARRRQHWTTCRRHCTSEQRSQRPRTAGTSTSETRGQASKSRTPPVATQPRRGAYPSLTNQTCSLRASLACCTFAGLAPGISQHSSAGSHRKPRYRLCPFVGASGHSGFGASGQLGTMPQGMHTGIKTLNNQ